MATVVSCWELTLRTVLRADSGLTELVMELMLEVMDRGFRATLIRGCKYDWNCAVDLDCVNYALHGRLVR
jgi:hypothetical protein